MSVTAEDIEMLFTRGDGSYGFARWGRAIAPVVLGVDEATLAVIRSACDSVVALAGHELTSVDPELGANLMIFFLRDWSELPGVPRLGDLVPDLIGLVARLQSRNANQYRAFRFDKAGAIQAAFVFLRMDAALSEMSAEDLAMGQVAQVMLAWSERAFATRAVLARAAGRTVIHPDIAAVIRAAYDPVMPVSAGDPSHALRLAARIGRP